MSLPLLAESRVSIKEIAMGICLKPRFQNPATEFHMEAKESVFNLTLFGPKK